MLLWMGFTEPDLLALEAHDHTCIKHAVELDQSIVEGAYDRVLRARHGVAHETYGYLCTFLPRLSGMANLEPML